MSFTEQQRFSQHLQCTRGTEYTIHRPFQVHTESKYQEVMAISNAIADEIKLILKWSVKHDKLRRHVRKVVLDLFLAAQENQNMWIDYPRRKQCFKKGSAQHRMHLEHKTFCAVVDGLLQLGYIEHLTGSHVLGLQSSMRGKTALLEMMIDSKVEPRMVYFDHEPVYLKNTDGLYIDVPESRANVRMANRVVSLNNLLSKTEITLTLNDDELREYITRYGRIPLLHRKTLYRVFNRGKFCYGGRFYGHSVQGLRGQYRLKLLIDGCNVCELDYGGMHIRLLYGLCGKEIPSGDVYDIGVSKEEAAIFQDKFGVSLRSVLKKMLLVGINAPSKRSSIMAVKKEFDSDDELQSFEKLSQPLLSDLWDAILEKHPGIADSIGEDVGIRLQRVDSDIADVILTVFVQQGKPIIPIHDSFVVRDQDRALLHSLMMTAWAKFIPEIAPIIELK